MERGVRFVQLYHTDWDRHGDQANNLSGALEARCKECDQPSAALVMDLMRRGLLNDTLVIWGGEFGRTPMGENRETRRRLRSHSFSHSAAAPRRQSERGRKQYRSRAF